MPEKYACAQLKLQTLTIIRRIKKSNYSLTLFYRTVLKNLRTCIMYVSVFTEAKLYHVHGSFLDGLMQIHITLASPCRTWLACLKFINPFYHISQIIDSI